MFLNRIRLRNFRCYEDETFYFRERLSVIVGNNGSGKTAILEAVAIAIGTMLCRIGGTSSLGINKVDARSEVHRIGNEKEVQPQFPVSIEAQGTCLGLNGTWIRSLNSLKGKTTMKDAVFMTDISQTLQNSIMKGDYEQVLPFIGYYGTSRLWDYHREKKSGSLKPNNRANGYVDCLGGSSNLKLMMDWFGKRSFQIAQNMIARNEYHDPCYDAVSASMERCFNLITGYDCHISYDYEEKSLLIGYTDIEGLEHILPMSQLSDGYRCTVSLVADIAYRMAILNPQFGGEVIGLTPGIVLIDEIDLHLHPEWQQRVLSDLMSIFPRLQFIVTTHAPEVINSVRKENLIILDNHRAIEYDSEVYGSDANSILKYVMNVNERQKDVIDMFEDFRDRLVHGNLVAAEEKLEEIASLIGTEDEEYVSCVTELNLMKWKSSR